MRRQRLVLYCIIGCILALALGMGYVVFRVSSNKARKVSSGSVVELFFLSDGQLLIVSNELDPTGSFMESKVQLLDFARDQRKTVISTPHLVVSAAISNDQRTLVLGDDSGGIEVYDLGSAKLRSRFVTDQGVAIGKIRFAPHDEKLESLAYESLAQGGPNTYRNVWDLESGKRVTSDQTHGEYFFPPLERDPYLAEITRRSLIEVRVVSDRSLLSSIETNWSEINCLVFSHDGRYVAAANGDLQGSGPPPRFTGIRAEVAVWESTTGTKVFQHTCHRGGVVTLSFSADDRYLASGDAIGEVAIVDVREGKCK